MNPILGLIRLVGRSAQRHQGGAHRAGDSRGAECPANLITTGCRLSLASHDQPSDEKTQNCYLNNSKLFNADVA